MKQHVCMIILRAPKQYDFHNMGIYRSVHALMTPQLDMQNGCVHTSLFTGATIIIISNNLMNLPRTRVSINHDKLS